MGHEEPFQARTLNDRVGSRAVLERVLARRRIISYGRRRANGTKGVDLALTVPDPDAAADHTSRLLTVWRFAIANLVGSSLMARS